MIRLDFAPALQRHATAPSMTLAAGRRWLAALRMGHFGVKLCASDDGARSWVERDAPDGTTLAIASTTGGLWLSDDGGDRWREVTTALPPVYALRFV